MKFRRKIFAKVIVVLLIIALLGWIVMRLWNWILPGLIGDVHVIDYPHAIGLLVLCRILFGGFRGGGGFHRGGHRQHWQHWQQWQQWQRMTPEERQQLRSAMKSACRQGGGSGGSNESGESGS